MILLVDAEDGVLSKFGRPHRLPNGVLGKTALPSVADSSLWLLKKAFGQALYDVIVGLFDGVDHAKEFHILG